MIPVVLEEGFLQVAIAKAAGAQAYLDFSADPGGGDEFEELHGQVLVRIRLGFGRGAGIHGDAHDLFAGGLLFAKDFNGVAVALAHLLAVDAGDEGGFFADLGFGNHEGLAILFIELDGDVTGHFHVLLLVLAHRDDVGIVEQNVSRHEHGIGKETVIHGNALGGLVFEGVPLFQQAHGGECGEEPGEFGDFGDIRLAEENGFLGIEAAGEEIQSDIPGILAPLGGVEEGGHGMVIGDEVQRLALVLQLNGRPHHPEIVSEVQGAAGLDAR